MANCSVVGTNGTDLFCQWGFPNVPLLTKFLFSIGLGLIIVLIGYFLLKDKLNEEENKNKKRGEQ